MSVRSRAAQNQVVFVRLVSKKFLDRCFKSGVDQYLAPSWGGPAANVTSQTIYNVITEVTRGEYNSVVQAPWYLLGLARLGDANIGPPEDTAWRQRLRERGWAEPAEDTYCIIDAQNVVDAIRQASANVDWSVLFANVFDEMPTSQPKGHAPVGPGPVIRKADADGVGHAAKRSRVSKHWNE